MWLEFQSPNDLKWYAETPAGEYAWADHQGLYEWRREHGQLQRIDYTGGDRQCSEPAGMWTWSGTVALFDGVPSGSGFSGGTVGLQVSHQLVEEISGPRRGARWHNHSHSCPWLYSTTGVATRVFQPAATQPMVWHRPTRQSTGSRAL